MHYFIYSLKVWCLKSYKIDMWQPVLVLFISFINITSVVSRRNHRLVLLVIIYIYFSRDFKGALDLGGRTHIHFLCAVRFNISIGIHNKALFCWRETFWEPEGYPLCENPEIKEPRLLRFRHKTLFINLFCVIFSSFLPCILMRYDIIFIVSFRFVFE